MVVVGAVLALLGFLKVRRIRGPRQTIESVKETRTALTPGHDKAAVAKLAGAAERPRRRSHRSLGLVDAGTGSVGHPHRRAMAPFGCARQRHPIPCRRGAVRRT